MAKSEKKQLKSRSLSKFNAIKARSNFITSDTRLAFNHL